MQDSLTPRQAELLAYIKERIAANNVAPSVREMQTQLGASSTSIIHGLLQQLKDRGHISIPPKTARRIRVIEP